MATEEGLAVAMRMIILGSMGAIGLISLRLSALLNQRIRPLADKLARLHHEAPGANDLQGELGKFKARYEDLLRHVDDVDTGEFSAGLIETLELRFFGRWLTAATAQQWIRQAPGILVSLGLLGTFAGLTVGLNQIGAILAKDLNPTEAMAALSELMTPMATAFETSLLGLFLSLILLIWTQISGTRTCLERCESLLSSWLETVLPRQLGIKVMTPLRQSLDNLNSTVNNLPDDVRSAVAIGLQAAFTAKLNEVFDAQTNLAYEARSAVRDLSRFASTLNESGQDFVEAAKAFRQSDFATTLERSAQSLVATREQLNASTEALSTRLFDVRDSLVSTQSEWLLLAKAAEHELEANRIMRQQIQEGIQTLHMATESMKLSTQTATESTKQLKEARLEVMRDRKLAIETATAIQQRLATDSSTAESCKAFALALESTLRNWNSNVERLNNLSNEFVRAVSNAKLEDEVKISEQSRMALDAISILREQMVSELGQAIDSQRSAITALKEPTSSAQATAQILLFQLEQLQRRISRLPVADPSTPKSTDSTR